MTSESLGELTRGERVLYHQIHPAKLAADWLSAAVAAWQLWRHALLPGLAVGLLVPAAASVWLLNSPSLPRIRASAFGRYVARFMTPAMQAMRLLGIAVVWIAAWWRWPFGIIVGLGVIVAAWLAGVRFQTRAR